MAKIKIPGGWLVGAVPEPNNSEKSAPAAVEAEEAPKKPRARGKQQ